MRIKGTSNPKCELCAFAVINDKKISCKLTNKKTEKKASCPKFKYDIFKYTPGQKMTLVSFRKKILKVNTVRLTNRKV